MTRICHFASNHEGLDPRIALKECASLAAAGYDTHLVITATTADVERGAKHGIVVHRLPTPGGRFGRMIGHTWRCYRAAKRVDAAIYHFHDPELIPWGLLLRLSGRRVVYDVHEDYPREILDKHWLPRWTRKSVADSISLLEYAGARWFFYVVAATPFIRERFSRVNPSAININNYPWPDELAPPEAGRSRACRPSEAPMRAVSPR